MSVKQAENWALVWNWNSLKRGRGRRQVASVRPECYLITGWWVLGGGAVGFEANIHVFLFVPMTLNWKESILYSCNFWYLGNFAMECYSTGLGSLNPLTWELARVCVLTETSTIFMVFWLKRDLQRGGPMPPDSTIWVRMLGSVSAQWEQQRSWMSLQRFKSKDNVSPWKFGGILGVALALQCPGLLVPWSLCRGAFSHSSLTWQTVTWSHWQQSWRVLEIWRQECLVKAGSPIISQWKLREHRDLDYFCRSGLCPSMEMWNLGFKS